MAKNTVNEEVLTIQEAVKEEEDIEEQAIAVLGAGDEDNCTYSLGYVNRQALFSCSTCDPLNEKLAGICYGCSLHCHEGHDLIELYTKRNFRCDCGNSKFKESKCTLNENKDEVNLENKYNHNFKGKYCTCERPYPDYEDLVEDEMIQCIICEDWFHTRHLGSLAPDTFSEMICDQCIAKKSFLNMYTHLQASPTIAIKKADTNENVDVMTTSQSLVPLQEHSTDTKDEKQTSCQLEYLRCNKSSEDNCKAVFLVENWRDRICHCATCMKMYDEEGISFITDLSDTIESYEKKGKENIEKVWEQAANQISQLNAVAKVELMHGYNDLKHGLTEFFKGFKENQVVRKEDIDGFFEELYKRKRMRLETGNGLPPDACK